MKKIEWSESLSVGIMEIDKQHRQLIEIINDLIDANAGKTGGETISSAISRLSNYLDYHFGAEEKYMLRFNFSGLSSHRNEHRVFIHKVFDFRKRFADGNEMIIPHMLAFLQDWLMHHIKETDKAYSACFLENGLI